MMLRRDICFLLMACTSPFLQFARVQKVCAETLGLGSGRPDASERLREKGASTRSKDMASHKGAQHHSSAADHHEHAAKHHREAAKHYESGAHEKGGHHAHVAQGHAAHAMTHGAEAAKHIAETHGSGKK